MIASLALFLFGAAVALLGASPSATPVAVRTVTLTPVEVASAYTKDCAGSLQPPYPHPTGTIFVGGLMRGQTICPAYQGLVRFDLDGLDAASIASARLFYSAKQNYNMDGTTDRTRATCIGSVGTTGQAWMSEEKAIQPVLEARDVVRMPRGTFKSPPIDVTAFLRAHLDDVKANGLIFNGTVENPSTRRCLAAIGQLELRLGISAGT